MRFMCKGALTALTTMLVVGAIGAGAALAAETPEWYGSTTKTTPEWQQGGAKISEAAATKSKAKVTLYDKGVPGEMECEGASEGTAGPGAADKTTSFTLTSCKATAKALNKKGEEKTNGCEKAVKAEAVALPWHTELVISKGSLFDTIVGEGGKAPGFKMTCKTLGIEAEDVCTVEKLTTSVTNAAGGVNDVFGSEQLNCTVGGKGEGEIATTQLIEANKGGKLEAKIAEGTFTKLTSAVAVTGTGKLTIEDRELGEALRCTFTLEGTVGAGAKGTVTSVSGSECVAPAKLKNGKEEEVSNKCERGLTEGAYYLPWSTELYESEGKIRDRFAASAEEKFSCESFGLWNSMLCGLNVSPAIVNGYEGNAFATFGERPTWSRCSGDSKEDEAVWSGELNFTPTSGAIKAEL